MTEENSTIPRPVRQREKRLALAPITKHGQQRWVLSGYYVEGKRVQKVFRRKADGERFIDAQRKLVKIAGRAATDVPPWVHTEAVQAYEILAPLGVSILEAARTVKALRERQAASVTVSHLIEAYTQSRKATGKKERTVQDVKNRGERFAADFADVLACNVTTAKCEDWIHALPSIGPRSRNHYRRVLHGAFAFAVRRGWAPFNPVAAVEKITVPDKAPGILTPAELRALLDAAPPALVPVIAIGAFAGLRPEQELGGLDWRSVNVKDRRIEVTSANSKTRDRRFVTMSENLAEWLAPFKKDFGPVCPPKLRKELDALHRVCGWGKPGTETAEEKAAGVTLRPWPRNALRHSFASYHIAQHKNASLTAHELGHRGNTAMLFNHYRELVTPEAAASWWAITPSAGAGVIVNFPATATGAA